MVYSEKHLIMEGWLRKLTYPIYSEMHDGRNGPRSGLPFNALCPPRNLGGTSLWRRCRSRWLTSGFNRCIYKYPNGTLHCQYLRCNSITSVKVTAYFPYIGSEAIGEKHILGITSACVVSTVAIAARHNKSNGGARCEVGGWIWNGYYEARIE